MNQLRQKEKLLSLTITLSLCFLIVFGTLYVKLWPRTVPLDQCSEVYRKYKDVDGVNATFVKDYRINDTVSVDVTMLEATDTNGWNIMKEDFHVCVLDSVTQRKIDNGKDLIFVKPIKKGSCYETADKDSPECDVEAISYLNQTICLFHVKSLEERRAVKYYNFDKTANQK